MQNESYQRLGVKTFFIKLLENNFITIFIAIVWMILISIKTIGVKEIFTFIETAQTINLIEASLNLLIAIGIFLILLSFSVALLFASVDYFTFYFMLDEHGLRIKQGLLYKKEIAVPYRQIQDINLNQTILYQILGMCRLNILTSGEDRDGNKDHNTEINIETIEKSSADKIRQELLARSNVQLVNSIH